MLKFCNFFNFHGVPPRTLEISGRRNWANVGNLDHFAQNERKKQQMLKNDEFWAFEDIRFLKKILTHKSNFQKYAQTRRNFCRPQNFGVVTLGPKKSSETRGRIFWPILTSEQSRMQNFTRFFTLKFFSETEISDHRGVSGGRQKFLTQKNFF